MSFRPPPSSSFTSCSPSSSSSSSPKWLAMFTKKARASNGDLAGLRACIQLLIQWTAYVYKMCHILLQNMKQTQILKHNFSPRSKTGPCLGSCPHTVLTAACGCHPKAHVWQPLRGDPGVLVPTTVLLGRPRKANYVLSLLFSFWT